MVNIVQLWDFEDGTTQGWTLGDYTTLDNTSQIQGTYSLKYNRQVNDNVDDLMASISGVDLSSTTKPMIVMAISDSSAVDYTNQPYELGIVVKDSGGTTLLDTTMYIYNNERYQRVPIIDLSPVAGQSNLTIEIRERGHNSGNTRTHYYDMIAIIDGADYEYSTGIMLFDDESVGLDIAVPTTDGDLSSITVDRYGLSLITPGWNYTWMKATANTNTDSAYIDSSSDVLKHTEFRIPSTAPSSFQNLHLDAKVSVGSYAYWTEKIAVMFLNGWTYQRLYLFNLIFTANGVSPRYASVVHTTTYGSTVSGSKDINFKAYGNSIEVALKAKYLEGDNTMVQSGTMTLTVYSSDKSTNYGSASIDLTTGTEQTTSYISGLPSNTDLILTYDWSITANARVIILAYPLVKIS